jgi:hypothetical protein
MGAAGHNGGERREGVDIGTLAVAAIAAVAAAVVTSKLWPGGTMLSTAMTPVIVAVVKEWLRKPAERISAVSAKAPEVAARVIAPARTGGSEGTAPVGSAPARVAEAAPTVPADGGERVVVPPVGSPAAGTAPEETFLEPAPADAPSRYRLYRRRGRHWRLAVVTGLVAFAAAALAITVPELVFGGSVTGNGSTTVFGGGSQGSSPSDKERRKESDAKRSGATGSSQPKQESTSNSTSKQNQQSKGSPSSGTSTPKQTPAGPGQPSQTPSNAGSPGASGQQGASGSASGSTQSGGQ